MYTLVEKQEKCLMDEGEKYDTKLMVKTPNITLHIIIHGLYMVNLRKLCILYIPNLISLGIAKKISETYTS